MPNRILKESICTSDTIAQLTPEEEVFFYRLIVVCDDYGRMDARPAILRARCFPLKIDEITENMITSWLKKLVDVGLIELYIVDDKPYLQITTWEKHQQVRAKNSKYPSPDEGIKSHDIICNQMQSDDSTCPRESKYENRESIYEKNNISDEILSSSEADDALAPSDSKKEKAPYKEIVELYNEICVSLPKVQEISEKRKRLIRTRWKRHPDLDYFRRLFQKAEDSDFLSGRNGKWAGCNFDWLMNENNAIKVLEGVYDNRADPTHECKVIDYEAASKSKYGW